MKFLSLFVLVALLATACSSSQNGNGASSEGQGSEHSEGGDGHADHDGDASNDENRTDTEQEMSKEETGGGDDASTGDADNGALLKAEAEVADFSSNIALKTENISNRLLSKFEYDLFVENNNEVLSLTKIKINVEYLSKRGESLGKTVIERAITVAPGESSKIYWSVDWVNIEVGTKECKFSIGSVESNVGSFQDLEA